MAGKQRVLVCNVAGAYDMPYFIILQVVTNTALQCAPLYFSMKVEKKLRSDMVFYSSSARYQFAGYYLYGGASQNNASETKSSGEACAMVLVSSRLPCL
jgi:hypothetical protein